MNEGGDLERERERGFKVLSQPGCWTDSFPRRCNQGLGLPGIWRAQGLPEGLEPRAPAPAPQWNASSPQWLPPGGLQTCIFGECFTLGNRPGILKERPPPSPAKVSFNCFRKEVPRKERQPGSGLSLSLHHYSLHSQKPLAAKPLGSPHE